MSDVEEPVLPDQDPSLEEARAEINPIPGFPLSYLPSPKGRQVSGRGMVPSKEEVRK